MSAVRAVVDALVQDRDLRDEQFLSLLSMSKKEADYLFLKAREVAQKKFSNNVYVRALIEVSNVCKNDCFYCGIRKSNTHLRRYILSKEDILSCAQEAYELGFRTFVLQGGEGLYYSDDVWCDIIRSLRKRHPSCAITLSVGEKSKDTYQRYYDAGANRYLLRHESKDEQHYKKLHPSSMKLSNRLQCLHALQEIGFQTGTGIMVGSPYQTHEHIVEDIRFLQSFQPEMIGIGPYIPHKDTPFHEHAKGSLLTTLIVVSICRIVCPNALIPATTALGSVQEGGREAGVRAGANVVMPNVSPDEWRKEYALYDNKLSSGEEAKEGLHLLQKNMQSIGYTLCFARGDHRKEDQ